MIDHITALFVRGDSIYKSLLTDCYDIDRDARNFSSDNVVITHPPCRGWGRMRHFATNVRPGELQLAIDAVAIVRRNGGVLEHPIGSSLWRFLNLPLSGFDEYGGFTRSIDQYWFGHKCRKTTLIYICGCAPFQVPRVSLCFGEPVFIACFSKRNRNKKKRVSVADRERTPVDFANWLISLAQIIHLNKHHE